MTADPAREALVAIGRGVVPAQRLAEASIPWETLHDETRSFDVLLKASLDLQRTAKEALAAFAPDAPTTPCAKLIGERVRTYLEKQAEFRGAYVEWLQRRRPELVTALRAGALPTVCGDKLNCDDEPFDWNSKAYGEPNGASYAGVNTITCTAELFVCGPKGAPCNMPQLASALGVVRGEQRSPVRTRAGQVVEFVWEEPTWVGQAGSARQQP